MIMKYWLCVCLGCHFVNLLCPLECPYSFVIAIETSLCAPQTGSSVACISNQQSTKMYSILSTNSSLVSYLHLILICLKCLHQFQSFRRTNKRTIKWFVLVHVFLLLVFVSIWNEMSNSVRHTCFHLCHLFIWCMRKIRSAVACILYCITNL